MISKSLAKQILDVQLPANATNGATGSAVNADGLIVNMFDEGVCASTNSNIDICEPQTANTVHQSL